VPADFEAYFRALAATSLDAKTEHSDRAALESLLNAAARAADPKLAIQHEPKRDKQGGGSPDYMVKRDGRIVGYVEVKTIDEALSKVLRSDQIKKYQKLSDNLILTDYLEFIWLKGAEPPVRARLAHSEDLSSRKLALRPESVEEVVGLLRGFFSTAPQNISRGQVLAVELAKRAALLRDFLAEELIRQEKADDKGRLHALYDAFRVQVFHDLGARDFADAFAQMLAYGLFLARLNAGANVEVTLDNVRRFIPGSFSLIRELVRFLEEMEEPEYRPTRWVIDEILSIVNGIDLAAIHNDLSFRARKATSRKVRAGDEEEHRLFEKDPFIYFYEDFLKAYDPAMRKGRGVYYTPPPVVNFIVRAVDDILKDTFGIRDGLADHRKVTVLDFACGTGTFLLEVFERIFETIGGPEAGRADQIVREHLTKNIYGFEYLIAPYTIAHLKLSQYLRDKGHPLEDQERLQVFLTNTLEPVEPQGNLLLPELSHEVAAAQNVKDRPILVITGNPPYSGHSKNMGSWIRSQIANYREGFPELSRRGQGKWLQDDYVKFLRFAQMKMDGGDYEAIDDRGNLQTVTMEGVDEGVVAVITNHSWLDNPTFKGMRKSLLSTFDRIYVLDLHGNRKKKEVCPDGSKDENVFDIEQGVAVTIFIKKSGLEKGVFHADFWGKRISKYQAAASASLSTTAWETIFPDKPDWRFAPQNEQLLQEYIRGWHTPDIFSPMGDPAPGFATQHDDFAISFTQKEAISKVKRFLALPNEAAARKEFKLCAQDQWRYDRAVDELPKLALHALSTEVTYRPFDDRWTIWDRNVTTHRRTRVSNHLMVPNVALVLAKNAAAIGSDAFDAVAISKNPVELNFFRRGGEFLFPAWIVDSGGSRSENLSAAFRKFLDERYAHHYSPEEILGYIYAILHAPSYRSRYAEFLRIDFPRIPFAETKAQFDALSQLGWALVQAHLLKAVPRPAGGRLGDYRGKGDHTVEAVRYSPEEQTIWINKTQGFAPVPPDIWDFHIGGYQVLDKYLKSRKSRTLNLNEQTHVGEVAESLAFTIEQMTRIDAAYLAAFPDGG
jgi:hypothetical protein